MEKTEEENRLAQLQQGAATKTQREQAAQKRAREAAARVPYRPATRPDSKSRYLCAYLDVCVYMFIHPHTHAGHQTRLKTQVFVRVLRCICIHVYTHTHTHIYIYIHTHINSYAGTIHTLIFFSKCVKLFRTCIYTHVHTHTQNDTAGVPKFWREKQLKRPHTGALPPKVRSAQTSSSKRAR